jgi:hypothetical protein
MPAGAPRAYLAQSTNSRARTWRQDVSSQEFEMHRAVVCVVSGRQQVNQVIQQLRAAKISNRDVSVLFSEQPQNIEYGRSDTAAGVAVATGPTLSWLEGLGSLAVPGAGQLVAAGPIVAVLGNAAARGAAAAIADALIEMGVADFEASRLERRVRSGSTLFAVQSDDGEELRRARIIFDRAGGVNICTISDRDVDRSNATESVPTML